MFLLLRIPIFSPRLSPSQHTLSTNIFQDFRDSAGFSFQITDIMRRTWMGMGFLFSYKIYSISIQNKAEGVVPGPDRVIVLGQMAAAVAIFITYRISIAGYIRRSRLDSNLKPESMRPSQSDTLKRINIENLGLAASIQYFLYR